jgi:transcriptional regulator GlxA family with amidase domain
MERLDGLLRLLMFIIGELDWAGPKMPSLTLQELEQAVIVSFLSNNEHNCSTLLQHAPQPAAAWQVRRAEEYIAAHWNEPITIEALADVTATSARSLFHHFRRTRGQSPMNFLKQVRLERAREMLMLSDSKMSVTEAALACGFGNLGHFARDYSLKFGERPSDTLNRAKLPRPNRG